MPLAIRWSTYTKEAVKTYETDYYGVYEIAHYETGVVLYIGEGQVKKRLLAHFPNGKEPVVGGNVYRVEYTGSKTRAFAKDKMLN